MGGVRALGEVGLESPEVGGFGSDDDFFALEFVEVAFEVDHAEAPGVALEEVGVFWGGAFDEDFELFADEGLVDFGLDLLLGGDEFLEAGLPGFEGDLFHVGSGGSGPGGVSEHEGPVEAEALHAGEGAFELFFGLSGEGDDNVGGESDFGDGVAELLDDGGVGFDGVEPFHAFEEVVVTSLEGHVAVLHDLGDVSDDLDEVGFEVSGVG